MKSLSSDERELLERLSELTEALEVASDVAVEFQSFMLGLELVPLHLDMLEKGVRSVLTQTLEVDMLPYMYELGARNADDAKSLKLVRASVQISRDGYA